MKTSVSFPETFTKENFTEAFDYYGEHVKNNRISAVRWVASCLFMLFWMPFSLCSIFAGLFTLASEEFNMLFLPFFKGGWNAVFLPLFNISSAWYVQLIILLAAIIAPPALFALAVRLLSTLLIKRSKYSRIVNCGDEIKKAKWLLKKKYTYAFNDFYFSCVIMGIYYLFCGVLFWSGFLSANENAGEVLLKNFPLGIISCLLLSLLEGLPALLLGLLIQFPIFNLILSHYAGMDDQVEFYRAVDAYWESVDPVEAKIREEARERLRREAEEEIRKHEAFARYLKTHPEADAMLTMRIAQRISDIRNGADIEAARRQAIWKEIDDMETAVNVANSVNASVPGTM